MLFADGPTTLEELRAIPPALPRPAMANMVEGGRTPALAATELAKLGYRLVIYPNSLVRLFARQGAALLEALHGSGSTEESRDRMLTFEELNLLLDTPDLLASGRRYAGE